MPPQYAPPAAARRSFATLVATGSFSGRLGAVVSRLARLAESEQRTSYTPEELLLAILDSGGAARTAIELLQADPVAIIRALGAVARIDESGNPPDGALQQIIADAAVQKAQLGASWLGTDHILLGILAVYRGPAYRVLKENGVQYAGVLAIIERMSG